MHHTLKRVEQERFADLIQNIIKKQTEATILQSVTAEMSNIKMKKLKKPKLLAKINELVFEMDYMEVPIGEHAGKPAVQVMTVGGKYNALKNFIEKRLFKKAIKVDSKTLDAIFYLHTYNYALISHTNKNVRKVLKIKKGFFS